MLQRSGHVQDWHLLRDFLRERGLEGAYEFLLLLSACFDGSGRDICLALGLGGRAGSQRYSLEGYRKSENLST